MVDVLVSTRESRTWSASVQYAAQVAAKFGGTLTALYIVPPPLVLPDAASMGFATELLEIEREEAEVAAHAQEPFLRWTRELGLRSATWRLAEGNESAVLQSSAKWSDVLVLNRPESSPATVSLESFGEAVMHADVPCLVVPPDVAAPAFGTAVVAWKGTAEATRALHASLPFLRRFERVVIIHGERGIPLEESDDSAQRAARHLLEHGVESTLERIDPKPHAAGDAILAAAKRQAADLLVMGAYGRARFSEWIFGGATRHALRYSPIPLFMRH